jgi:hypothetical protein
VVPASADLRRGHGPSNAQYDRALVENGPLPPHERSWRHPSELGPTKHDVDHGRGNHFGALAGGAVAVLAVAAMVVAMTPRTTSGPLAVSSTTTGAEVASLAPPGTPAPPRPAGVASGMTGAAVLASFSASPHAVASGPELTLDGSDIADGHPADDDVVLLRTDAVTYRLPWGLVPYLEIPDGSVVFDVDGSIVAHVTGSELVSVVAD